MIFAKVEQAHIYTDIIQENVSSFIWYDVVVVIIRWYPLYKKCDWSK